MIGDSVAIVGPIRNRAVSVEQNTPQRNPLVCRRKVSNNPQFGYLAKLPVVFFPAGRSRNWRILSKNYFQKIKSTLIELKFCLNYRHLHDVK